MADRIRLTVRYSFRGETHQPTVMLDLDRAMREQGCLPDFLLVLAQANDMNLHGYEYEVLPYGEFLWSEAEGLAADCLDGGDFDTAAFESRWTEREQLRKLAGIARRHLGVERLEQKPELQQALLEAYRQGLADGAGK